jgi:hypothetical protein
MKLDVKTNQITWDKTNAAGMTLTVDEPNRNEKGTTRGLTILVAPVTARKYTRIL